MFYKTLIKISVSILFLAYIICKIDMAFLLEIVLSIDPKYYFVSTLFIILNSVILAIKYKIVMVPSGIHQSLTQLIKINFICRFYSMFLTTAVGQSVIRWHMSTKNQEGRLKFITVMFFERSTFFFALFIALAIPLLFISIPGSKVISNTIYPFITTGLSGLVLFYFILNFSPFFLLIKKIIEKTKIANNWTPIAKLIEYCNSFSIYLNQRRLLISTLSLSLVWHFFFLTRVYLLIISIQVPLNFSHLAWIASLVLFFQMFPISLNGIGIRETAYAFLFKLHGLPPEKGVLIGMLLFSQVLLMSGIGGIFHLVSRD